MITTAKIYLAIGIDGRSSVLKTNHLYNTNTRTFKPAGNLTIKKYDYVNLKLKTSMSVQTVIV